MYAGVRASSRVRAGAAAARDAVRLLSALALVVLVSCSGSADSNRAALQTSTPSSPSPSVQEAGGHYQGPEVAFDFPDGWHEFYLEISAPFFAAYGPVSGGKVDYVTIAPIPDSMRGSPPEDVLADPSVRTGPVEQVDVNGMPGYSVDVAMSGQDLAGQQTLVQGKEGDYVVMCQYGPDMSELVSVGCEMLKGTLVEVPTADITDPSGCTDAELALLRSVPLPDQTSAETPSVQQAGTDRLCDVMVTSAQPTGIEGDLVAYFSSGLEADGWHIETAKIVEQTPLQKWRVVADRDWDYYMVEIYVDAQGDIYEKGATQMFFITVVDG